MGKTIGIDLGTTNSCVAIVEGGEPLVIQNSEGGRTTPSIVAFSKDDERLIGDSAKRQAVTNPTKTISSVKRFMGSTYKELNDNVKSVSYKVSEGENGITTIKIDDKSYTPQEISAMVLQKMKKSAEDYLGEEVTDAVITVPAYFNDTQRKATQDAGAIAGLNVKRIINEPTAAALAYGLDKKDEDQVIAVYDLGGGTFDISILELGDGIFEVKSTNGDTHLGGDNFDEKIIDWVVSEFKKDEGIDLSKDNMALQRIKDAAEKAKIELSSSSKTTINLPFITANQDGPKHLNYDLTRSKFEQLVDDLIKRALEPCKKALKDSGFKKEEIDQVILVGGTTRIPKVQDSVKEFFGKEPSKGVNPDEVVALGAAIQGAVLSGDINDVVLLDVTPLSLGIETMGGVMTKMIEANTTIPTSKTEVFSTAADNQTSVEIHILQGERTMVKDNRTLGRFHVDGIPSAPRGVPQIEVKFDIDANGVLSVSAKDKATNKEQSIRIESSSGLSQEEIERMRKEAKENEQKDKEEMEKITKINNADNQVFSIEKTLKESEDKLTEDEIANVKIELEKMKEVISKKDMDTFDETLESLNKVWSEIAIKLYSQASEEEQKTETNEQKDNDSVDAEFEVIDEDK